MSKYKDRKGIHIKLGDVLARVITCNHQSFRGFCFAVFIVKKRGRALVGDGVHGWFWLNDTPANELAVLTPETDLRVLECDFLREWPRDYNR